jgi:uncharacterized protein YegL
MTEIDYSGNPNQRTPCVLVLDASGSMDSKTSSGKTRIQELNEGIQALQSELQADDTALVRVMLSIVIVGGPTNDAEVLMDWTDATQFQPFPLRADGTTPLGKGLSIGLELIEEVKGDLRRNGVSYTRPWMIVISDGDPTDEGDVWQAAVLECQAAEAQRKVEIFSIGVDGANLNTLGRISQKPALSIQSVRFRELFVWLSASLSAASRSRPGDTLALPPTDPWRNVGI